MVSFLDDRLFGFLILALNPSLTYLANENVGTFVNNKSIFSNKFKLLSLLTFVSMLKHNASKFDLTQGLPWIFWTNCTELIPVWKFELDEQNIFSHSIKIFCALSLTLQNPPRSCEFIKVCVLSESMLWNNKIEEHCLEYSLFTFLENLNFVNDLWTIHTPQYTVNFTDLSQKLFLLKKRQKLVSNFR